MATQLRNCLVRCGASGFAVDYWGHRDFVGAPQKTSSPLPRAPRPSPPPSKSRVLRETSWHPALTSPFRFPRTPPGAHFLTHAHSDHLVGLKNDWRSPTGAKIYCTAITEALILRKYPKLLDGPTSIVTLATDQPTVVDLGGTGELLTVTAIDAGHCPGSVGFLFEGTCGRIYHTGDFRREDWCVAGDDGKSANIPECLTRAPLDLLLLDNTYCNPAYRFPSRAAAQAAVVSLIVDRYPDREVVLGLDSLGKEPLIAAVAAATGQPVRCTKERFDAAAAARDASLRADEEVPVLADDDDDDDDDGNASPDLRQYDGLGLRGSTEYSAAPRDGTMAFDASAKGRVWAFPKQRVTRDMLTARAVNSGRKVLGILPTGWAATGAAGLPSTLVGEDTRTAGGGNAAGGASADDDDDEPAVVRAVPYSLHAPYEELRAIVRALAPVAVVGNTKPPRSPNAPANDPETFFSRLLSDPRSSDDDDDDDDEDEKSDDAGFLDGKENDGDGHGIVRVFDAGAKAKKNAAPVSKIAPIVAPRRMALARSAPGLAKTPPPVAPVPSRDDEDEEDASADAATSPAASASVSIAPTASGDSNGGCSLDAPLDGTETARIRDDPGVDSCLSTMTSAANDDRLRERQSAVAFARALIDGDGAAKGAKRWAKAAARAAAKASDGAGGDGKKRRRLPAGWAVRAGTGARTRTRC